MELSWNQRDPRWNLRWNSAGSKGIRDGIQDGIPGGTQMESKEAKEAKEAKESKESKIDSQDRIQVTQEEMPGTKKRPAITGRSLKSIAN